MKGPLVSCITPTSFERSTFRDNMYACFNKQTYKAVEHIVWEMKDEISVGEARNMCIREAVGSIIAHFDDDDWSHPDRLQRCVAAMARNGDPADCVYTSLIYYRSPANEKAWLVDGVMLDWIPGGTLVYKRRLWEGHIFNPFLEYGEDNAWCKGSDPMDYFYDLRDPSLYVATIHEGNTSPKHPHGPAWTPVPYEQVEELIASNS